MRGLTLEERGVLEGRHSVDYETGKALEARGLLRHVEIPGVEYCNPCETTAEGKRALWLDYLARLKLP